MQRKTFGSNSNLLIPTVIEKEGNDRYSYDIYSRLLKDRIILLMDAVTDAAASSIVAQMLFLQQQDKKKDINFYMNSPGGSITAGMAIYDTMQLIDCDVSTVCLGQCASMGAILLSGGTKGKRFSLPNARIMIHDASSGVEGKCTDMKIAIAETERLRIELYKILAKNTGKDYDKIFKDCDRDYFMSAQEALEYGIIDRVL